LFIDLFRAKTNVCGTVRFSRKNMLEDLRKIKLKRREIEYRSMGKGLLAMLWRDKHDVRLLSTMHSADMVDSGKRARDGNPVMKPAVAVDYNQGMGGVDRSDQYAKTYHIARKSKKWYRKLFFHLLDMAITNAWLVFKKLKEENAISQADFRRRLMEEMLETAELPTYPGRGRKPLYQEEKEKLDHTLIHVPATEKRANAMRRCVHCKKNGVSRSTRYMCGKCEVPLCVVPCFGEYLHAK
jgi:hypothetical protein